MKIVRIFAPEISLCAIHYGDEITDEYDRLMELWHDPEYLTGFFDKNRKDLESGFWGNISETDAVIDTIESATNFDDKVNVAVQKKQLDTIFRQLDNLQTTQPLFSKSKAKRHWLRLYALRIEENHYVITGGAIKLTHKMSEAEHTEKELQKIDRVKRFLLKEGIVDADGIEEVSVDL